MNKPSQRPKPDFSLERVLHSIVEAVSGIIFPIKEALRDKSKDYDTKVLMLMDLTNGKITAIIGERTGIALGYQITRSAAGSDVPWEEYAVPISNRLIARGLIAAKDPKEPNVYTITEAGKMAYQTA